MTVWLIKLKLYSQKHSLLYAVRFLTTIKKFTLSLASVQGYTNQDVEIFMQSNQK